MNHPLHNHTVEAALRLDGYPEASVEAWRKFRNRAATLYPYRRRDDGTAFAVETPKGRAVLVNVLGPSAFVLLDDEEYDEDRDFYPTRIIEARTVSPAAGTREELDARTDNGDGADGNRMVALDGGAAATGGGDKANARRARRSAGRHADPDDGQVPLLAFDEAEEEAGPEPA